MDARRLSPINRDVPLAREWELAPLAVGAIRVRPPVAPAPMASATNPPFRLLCRRFGGGLFVNEMITARARVDGRGKTFLLASLDPSETVRGLRLYGSGPRLVGETTRIGGPTLL